MHYIRKTKILSYSQEQIQRAVNACKNGEMGIRRAAEQFDIPKSTLAKKVRLAKNGKDFSVHLGRKPSLPLESETELAQLILDMEGRGFGLFRNDVRVLAYEYAVSNNLHHDFNEETKMAGRFWLQGFLKRHPNIVPRKAEGLSKARASGMNRQVVGTYFDRLGAILDREGLHQAPEKIYNVDETGVPLINRPGVVLAQKGKHSVVTITDNEKGENVTAVGCCSASGQYVPPYIIMKGKRLREEYKDGLPAGSKVAMSDTSYINKELFLDWLQHFRKHAVSGKVLLIIDGHSSHVKSTAVLQYCMKNDIILVCLPGHTTKYLQPLDRTVYRSLKVNFQNTANLFKRRNPESSITKYRFGALFNEAWTKTATIGNAASGFRACGIFPFNPDAIPEDAYLPAELTERELPDQAEEPMDTDDSDLAGPEAPVDDNVLSQQPASSSVTTTDQGTK